jgi:hypothetical protein
MKQEEHTQEESESMDVDVPMPAARERCYLPTWLPFFHAINTPLNSAFNS